MRERLVNQLETLLYWPESPFFLPEQQSWTLPGLSHWARCWRPLVTLLMRIQPLQYDPSLFARLDWSAYAQGEWGTDSGQSQLYQMIRLWCEGRSVAVSLRNQQGNTEKQFRELAQRTLGAFRKQFKEGPTLYPWEVLDWARHSSIHTTLQLLDNYFAQALRPLLELHFSVQLTGIPDSEKKLLERYLDPAYEQFDRLPPGFQKGYTSLCKQFEQAYRVRFWESYLSDTASDPLWFSEEDPEERREIRQCALLDAAHQRFYRSILTQDPIFPSSVNAADPVARLLREGEDLQAAQRWEEAYLTYEQAIDQGGKGSDFYWRAAYCSFQDDNPEETLRLVEECRRQYPLTRNLAVLGGYAAQQMNRYDRALQFFEQVREIEERENHKPTPDALVGLARSYAGKGMFEKSYVAYQKLTETYPENVVFWIERVNLLFNREEYEAAERAVNQALQRFSGNLQLLLARCRILSMDPALCDWEIVNEDMEKIRETLLAFKKATPLPLLEEFIHIANSMGAQGMIGSVLLHELEKDPEDLNILGAVARHLAVRGQESEAEQLLEVLHDRYPNRPEIWIIEGMTYMDLHQFDPALEALQEAEDQGGMRPEIAMGRARCYELLGDEEESRYWLNEYIELSRNLEIGWIEVDDSASPEEGEED